MSRTYAGLDVGTTWIKAALVDGDGVERVIERVPTPWQEVPTGAEADAGDIFHACNDVLGRALERSAGTTLSGIGITGMAETGVLLDGVTPVSPCIAWFDRRGLDAAVRIGSELGETFSRRTGLPASNLCSLAKLIWLIEREGRLPGTSWLDLPAYVAYRLTGRVGTEVSLSCRTGLLDVRTAVPLRASLDLVGAPEDFLAPLIPAGEAWGEARSGPGRSSVVTVAGHDDPVAAIGAGAVDGGDVFDSCGTAEAFLRSMPDDLSDKQVTDLVGRGCTVGVLPGDGLRALGGFEAGGIIARWRKKLEAKGDIDAIDKAASRLPPGAGGVAIEDLWDEPKVVGSDEPRPEQLWRALFEALAERGRAGLEAMEEIAGPPERFVVSGGGAVGHTVRAVKSERFMNLVTPQVGEAAARGAAIAAGVAVGVWAAFDAAPRPPLHPYG